MRVNAGTPMQQMDQRERHLEEGAPDKDGAPEAKGLGAFLRGERERIGLSREEVAERTRMRRDIVAALENEMWDALPQPAFVRGFVRSYAKILSLDEKRALDLYEDAAGKQFVSSGPLQEPRPRGGRRIALVVVFLIALSGLVYLLRTYPDGTGGATPESKPTLREMKDTKAATPAPAVIPQPEREAPVPEIVPAPVVPSEDVSPPKEGPASAGTTLQENWPGSAEDQTVLAAEESVTVEPARALPPDEEWLVLQAEVKLRTWLRIYVDDQEPREYIFQPGSRPQWKAKKGFNLLVGNAAGVELDFNGRKLVDLGRLGQVVRMNLPEGFQSTRYEE